MFRRGTGVLENDWNLPRSVDLRINWCFNLARPPNRVRWRTSAAILRTIPLAGNSTWVSYGRMVGQGREPFLQDQANSRWTSEEGDRRVAASSNQGCRLTAAAPVAFQGTFVAGAA